MKRDPQTGEVSETPEAETPETLLRRVARAVAAAEEVWTKGPQGEAKEWEEVFMQAAFQRHCDSSISKTINFPSTASVKDIRDIYLFRAIR